MSKRLVYIFIILIFTYRVSLAKPCSGHLLQIVKSHNLPLNSTFVITYESDTIKVKKIKEIARSRRQAKPIKLDAARIDTINNKPKTKPRRQQRPDGLERPPEIPRRNNN